MPAITIRNVPENVRNGWQRAANRGQSLQEYLRAELIAPWLMRTPPGI